MTPGLFPECGGSRNRPEQSISGMDCGTVGLVQSMDTSQVMRHFISPGGRWNPSLYSSPLSPLPIKVTRKGILSTPPQLVQTEKHPSAATGPIPTGMTPRPDRHLVWASAWLMILIADASCIMVIVVYIFFYLVIDVLAR